MLSSVNLGDTVVSAKGNAYRHENANSLTDTMRISVLKIKRTEKIIPYDSNITSFRRNAEKYAV